MIWPTMMGGFGWGGSLLTLLVVILAIALLGVLVWAALCQGFWTRTLGVENGSLLVFEA